MFKIIGVGVVALVLFWGFDSIRKWYEGDATPQEVVGEVRKVVGERILGSDDVSPKSAKEDVPNQKNAQEGGSPADKPLGTDDMLKKLMKD